MTCITLTRITFARTFGAQPTPAWQVAYEGQLVATYAEEVDGWLRQIGSSRLDASLHGHASTWGRVHEYPNLDELREEYVLRAKAWEAGGDSSRG